MITIGWSESYSCGYSSSSTDSKVSISVSDFSKSPSLSSSSFIGSLGLNFLVCSY